MSLSQRVLQLDQTIVAVSSPAGAGRRAIVRLSGPDALCAAAKLFTPALPRVGFGWTSGTLCLSPGCRLPALCYVMRGPRSYTRQDVVELHLPGSPPLVGRLLQRFLALGMRTAEAGEFTLRAVLNGRIDLARAGAVADLIDADSPEALRAAMDELSGGRGSRLEALMDRLANLGAELEAALDFPEEDIAPATVCEIAGTIHGLQEQLRSLAEDSEQRSVRVERPRVVIAGPVNAGKSRLLNALADRPAALVAPTPGTTRDHVRALCTWDGMPMELLDTAGEAPPADAIDAEAQQAGRRQRDRAALVLWCLDLSRPLPDTWDDALLADHVLPVLTKADLPPGWNPADALPSRWRDRAVVTSALDGQGIQHLRSRVAAAVRTGQARPGGATSAVHADQAAGLREAASALDRARECLGVDGQLELAAVEVRTALDTLGRTTHAIDNDDLLDRVFCRFCIGK